MKRYHTNNRNQFRLLEVNKLYRLKWDYHNLDSVVKIVEIAPDQHSLKFEIIMKNDNTTVSVFEIGMVRHWSCSSDTSYFEDLEDLEE